MTNACTRAASKSPEDMEDFKDLEPVLNKLKQDEMSRYAEFNQLRRVIERGKMFEYITYSLKNELDGAYRHNLRLYCLSFQPEGRNQVGEMNMVSICI